MACVSIFVFVATANLETGQLDATGPGFMPKIMAGVLGFLAMILMARSLLVEGDKPGRPAFRAPALIVAALLIFAATVRAIGLFPAGVLLCFLGGLADPSNRPVPLFIFSIITAAVVCIFFKYLFGIQLPSVAFPYIGRP
ncbi:MAG: tripartite tricarboxylate transporter TctB family protein [Rhizobiaceae bacterium]|nr:tripartite tricarboxylate transporter TctB family protein [Rhizobiaceae bacterium]